MPDLWTRWKIIGSLAMAFAAPGASAGQLALTPKQTDGPFYPIRLPLDTDNDLIIINDGITPAVGEVTHLPGRPLDAKARDSVIVGFATVKSSKTDEPAAMFDIVIGFTPTDMAH